MKKEYLFRWLLWAHLFEHWSNCQGCSVCCLFRVVEWPSSLQLQYLLVVWRKGVLQEQAPKAVPSSSGWFDALVLCTYHTSDHSTQWDIDSSRANVLCHNSGNWCLCHFGYLLFGSLSGRIKTCKIVQGRNALLLHGMQMKSVYCTCLIIVLRATNTWHNDARKTWDDTFRSRVVQ